MAAWRRRTAGATRGWDTMLTRRYGVALGIAVRWLRRSTMRANCLRASTRRIEREMKKQSPVVVWGHSVLLATGMSGC
jgi:hypothetical protein